MTSPPLPGQGVVVPESAYVGTAGQSNSVSELSEMTEAKAKSLMQGTVAPSFEAQRSGFWDRIDDLISMFTGNYSGTLPVFVDGQLAINDRIDLLGQSGYCAAYMTNNLQLAPNRDRALPFDTQIGPAQRAELAEVYRDHPGSTGGMKYEQCIQLNSAGLWQANATFNHMGVGFDRAQSEIVVLRPDLTVYSYTTLPAASEKADGGSLGDVDRGSPVTLFKSFVVPSPGYYVQVRWKFRMVGFGSRTAKGGARMSQFSVVQWSDSAEHGDADDDATGTIDDSE